MVLSAGRAKPMAGAYESKPSALFEEISPASSGISWRHVNGRSPETIYPKPPAPAAHFSITTRRLMDIYLVNSGKCDFFDPSPPLRNALYRNNETELSTDVTDKAGVAAVATAWASRSEITTATVCPIFM